MFHVVLVDGELGEIDGRFAANQKEIQDAAYELIKHNFPLNDGDHIRIIKVK